jgi:hypothetical protein
MALLAQQIPEVRGIGAISILEADFLGARRNPWFRFASLGKAGHIALHVGAEHWNSLIGKAFGQALQRDGLARPRGAGDQAVAIGEPEINEFRLGTLPEIDAVGRGLALTSLAFSRLRLRARRSLEGVRFKHQWLNHFWTMPARGKPPGGQWSPRR